MPNKKANCISFQSYSYNYTKDLHFFSFLIKQRICILPANINKYNFYYVYISIIYPPAKSSQLQIILYITYNSILCYSLPLFSHKDTSTFKKKKRVREKDNKSSEFSCRKQVLRREKIWRDWEKQKWSWDSVLSFFFSSLLLWWVWILRPKRYL